MKRKFINKLIFFVIFIFALLLISCKSKVQADAVQEEIVYNQLNSQNSVGGIRIEDMRKALQEVAYSYYMRSTNIQYNSMKGNPSWYSPEEATSQNINYIVCSAFTKNVYNDLLGVKIPPYTYSLISYAKKYVGNPEVIAYGNMQDDNFVLKLYDEESENNYKCITNPTLQDLIPYLQVRRCSYIYRTCCYGL